MKLPVFESIGDLQSQFRHGTGEGFAFILKKQIDPIHCEQIISELFHWSKNIPEQCHKDPYPKGVYNLHLKVKQDGSAPNEHLRSRLGSDFHESYTKINVRNYRIGWLDDPELDNALPKFREVGRKILNNYKLLTGKNFNHGPGGDKNLFFEFAQYPIGSGYIEKHTHLRNIDNGQKWNMLTLLTQNNIEHRSSGLVFEKDGVLYDTTNLLDKGDSVLFRMDIPHYVNKVEAPLKPTVSPISGRWTMGLFYY